MSENHEYNDQEKETTNSQTSIEKKTSWTTDTGNSMEIYTKEEETSIREYIKIIEERSFRNAEEVCEQVQAFIYVSKYNLKRNSSKSNSNITFLCSCVSKKRNKTKDTDGFLEQNQLNLDTSLHTSLRKVKRENEESCKYRLKFKYDSLTGWYSFIKGSNLEHNHYPDQSKHFEYLFRNLKFPLSLVVNVYKTMIDAIHHEQSLTPEFITNLKSSSFQDLALHNNSVKLLDKKIQRNIHKKLNYYIIQIKNKVLEMSGNGLQPKETMYKEIISDILKKRAASYLSFSDKEQLKDLMET